MLKTEEIVYIGLGSNLDRPKNQIRKAIERFKALSEVTFLRASSLYRFFPWGVTDQPDFVNAVIKISTSLSPRALLMALLAIEAAQGRVRRVRWGPRVLDCDILLYGQKIIQEAGLVIPHPHMHERTFVLLPLVEIAPDLMLPSGEKAAIVLAQLKNSERVKETA